MQLCTGPPLLFFYAWYNFYIQSLPHIERLTLTSRQPSLPGQHKVLLRILAAVPGATGTLTEVNASVTELDAAGLELDAAGIELDTAETELDAV